MKKHNSEKTPSPAEMVDMMAAEMQKAMWKTLFKNKNEGIDLSGIEFLEFKNNKGEVVRVDLTKNENH